MFRQPPTSRTQLRIVLGDHPFLEIFTEMHIESTSLSNDQLKSSLIPLVFQREALLSADPQLDATDENNLPPEVQMRSSRQRASSTTAKTPKRKFSLASPSSPEKFSPSSGAKRNSALLRHDEIDPIHLKGTEMWPLADEHGRPSNRDIGAGWVPIYISQCSTINNPIFEDDRHVIVTDHHIHVTKPLIREKTDDYRTAFEFSIRISRIVEVLSGNSTHFFFQQVFPEVTIKFQEMKLIKPPGQRIPLKNYSVANSVSTLVLRTSRRAWQLPLYISRAQTNSNIRSLYSTAAYHDLQDVRDFEHLERRLCNAVRVNPLGKLQVHLVDIERKAHWMKEMGELATANRAVKTAFWKIHF
ncbi:hypothetical protein BC830DRAFT_894712 [Chytriomyces sp. MP71]|nr:hypothetical protein BC830DRAFT_894712 [Chytriomyces sp. MP71]